MKTLFYRVAILIAGLALLMDGLALGDFLLHPLAQDHNFHSTLYRAVTALVLIPFALLVGFLIIRRVPGNVVGPLLIGWSGTIAYNSIRDEIGLPLFGLYYAYDIVFGWMSLYLMFLHFPDGKIHPPGAARWIYRLLGFNFLTNCLIFLSTDPLLVPTQPENIFFLPDLLPYADLMIWTGLALSVPMLALTPLAFVLRYRKGSLLERQQIKWLALFGGILILYIVPVMVVYPLLNGEPMMTPGAGLPGLLFYLICGLFPSLAIGVSILRYRLWDIDRIIRRTLVYSILTVILALIYLGSVVVLQTTFAFFFQLGSDEPAIILSTLAIAAAFSPLRSQIQRSIDQRFFRQKYNIDQTVDRFAATARTEVMLEPLISALFDNLEETMQPEEISLWLRSAPNKNNREPNLS